MNAITVIVESDAEGILHIPLPPEMRHGKVRVEAKLEPERRGGVIPGLWKDLPGKFWMSEDFDEPLEDFKEYME